MFGIYLCSGGFGGYISIFKLVVFVLLFFVWLWFFKWAENDCGEVGVNEKLWRPVVLGVGTVCAFLWLISPMFIVGLAIYLLVVGGTAITYIKQRNAQVLEYERVLTSDHLKSLFSSRGKDKLSTIKNFLFVTANNNEISMPRPKTPEFFGYRAAYDIFNDASWHRASSVLLTPTPEEYMVVYQIDGVVLKQPSMDREKAKYFIHFVKSLADLDVKEKRKPQKSTFKIKREKGNMEWEVTTAGSTAGERVHFRMLGGEQISRIADLGLRHEQQQQILSLRDSDHGVFLITGPKKSGITTTLYALMRNHDAYINSIEILEKSPAGELANIGRTVYSLSDTSTTTYGRRLQTIIRMGPDIIGVGECPDGETAKVAATAGSQKRIVYVILEATSAVAAFEKWLKFVGNKELACSSLLGISNQQLLRKLCDECKQGYRPNKELLRKFNIPVDKSKVLYRAGKVIYDKHGKEITCQNCQGTGFVGRTGIFELIMFDDNIRDQVKQAKTLREIGKIFRGGKMLYLQEEGLRKVLGSVTAINEMVRVLSQSKMSQTSAKKK